LIAHAEHTGAAADHGGPISQYLAAIRAHPWLVVLITAAAVGASVALLVTRAPSYEATADLLLSPIPADDTTYTGLPVVQDVPGDPTRAVETAASLIDSRSAADLAAEEMGAGWTGSRVLDSVDVTPQGQSDIVAITATADDPDVAARLANEYARAVLEVRARTLARIARPEIRSLKARLQRPTPADQAARPQLAARLDALQSVEQSGDPTIQLAEPAAPPTAASGPPAALIVVVALIAGLALGSGTAVVIGMVQRRVRDLDEALRIYPLPVLARVPELSARKRKGPRDAIWYMPAEVREAFFTLTAQLDANAGSKGVVMVTSPSTGDGKTNAAINLAVALASSGKRVILLDFDLRKPQIGRYLDLGEGHALTALANGNTQLAELLVPVSDSLSVLPLGATDGDPGLTQIVNANLVGFVDEARELADCVVIDTAPLGEVSDALRHARYVDDLLVVLRPRNSNRAHIRLLRDLLERIGRTPTGYVVIAPVDRSAGYTTYGVGAQSASSREVERI
jgi:Mrp family chromosome partitioning ATPase